MNKIQKKKYILRLDDACEYMDINKWERIEELLDSNFIQPIVSVIPNCKDKMFITKYENNSDFWNKARKWNEKGWIIGLHGYSHSYHKINKGEGINPVNDFSEFVGLSLKEQKDKLKQGLKIFDENKIIPSVFVAPGHTFDENTLEALKSETDINIISDTIASDVYFHNNFYFVPQQTGKFRKLPFKIITAAYHPNTMNDKDFENLNRFIIKNRSKFINLNKTFLKKRRMSFYDKILKMAYFTFRKIRKRQQNVK